MRPKHTLICSDPKNENVFFLRPKETHSNSIVLLKVHTNILSRQGVFSNKGPSLKLRLNLIKAHNKTLGMWVITSCRKWVLAQCIKDCQEGDCLVGSIYGNIDRVNLQVC